MSIFKKFKQVEVPLLFLIIALPISFGLMTLLAKLEIEKDKDRND